MYINTATLLCSTSNKCTLTYHRYIFWFLVDCCITNAFILARECRPAGCGARMDLKSFRIQLVQGLIGGYNSRKRYSLPAAVYEVALYRSSPPSGRRGGDPAVSSTGHFPVHGSKGRCCYCWNIKSRRHESTVWCRQCARALCTHSRDAGEASCFERWHTEGHAI